MKKAGLILLTLVITLLFLHSFSATSDAYVYVNGYYRSNGTYVKPYVRSEPNGIKYDNYSYKSGDLYNKSYNDYSRPSTWRTPSYQTDPYYYQGKSLYNSNSSSYKSYNYNYNY